ncbi:hypothetical protein CROQUDRAFT_658787 [Cronartium quercuum f. sp. fusiforme G11]|uniref:Uncharacterized protein n=1 Tax=Cronartium quercuum f. sp. fusiforme G11 TaxID=708437 RepID=A0A9P6TC71_9BASI|nr:hypothetical protein CROQUDRAFT_658787 [Cronartium quercuum f. sp. fusiforme G11]
MTERSRLSALSAHSNLSNHSSTTLDELYQHTLRVAYLSHLTSARTQALALQGESSAITTPNSPPSKTGSLHRPHLRHQAETWTNALFSIGDVFKDTGGSKEGKSAKFPKELVKVLKDKIEAIAKGTDKYHQDMLLRSTFGVFYGTYTSDSFLKQLKENRKIEELILSFVTTATNILKKRLDGDEWKVHLNSQVGIFVTIIRDCLRSKDVKGVSPELNARLDSYASKLVPPNLEPNPLPNRNDFRQSTHISSSSTPLASSSTSESASVSAWAVSYNVHDMSLVLLVGQLFGVSEAQLQKDVNAIRKFCTEKAALEDLKLCISNLSQQCRFPGRRADFASDEAYQEWRKQELSTLQQAMLQMIKTNPELVQTQSSNGNSGSSDSSNTVSGHRTSISDDFVVIGGREGAGTPTHKQAVGSGSAGVSQRNSLMRPDSVSSAGVLNNSVSGVALDESLFQMLYLGSEIETELAKPIGEGDYNLEIDDEDPDKNQLNQSFTYVPSNPPNYYIKLMDQCLDYDLESMKNLAEDEEVSLKILTTSHLDLLEQCSFRWRLMSPFQVVVFFNGICKRFEEEEIPIIECVIEALNDVFRLLKEVQLDHWTLRDQTMISKTMSSLFDTLLRRVYEAIQSIVDSKPTDDLADLLNTLILVYESEPFQMITDLEQRFHEFTEAVTELYDRLYAIKSNELFARDRPNDIVPFLDLIAWLNSSSSRLNKRFKQPLLERIDLVSIFLDRLCKILVQDVDAMRAMLLPSPIPPPAMGQMAALGTKPVTVEGSQPVSNVNDADILDLYRSLLDIKKKHDMCNDTKLVLLIDEWFGPYMQSWLDSVDSKTSGWVKSAIEADKFVREGNDSHSSSIIDLMDSCKSAVDFVQKLNWPDEYQNAKFLTRLARTISKSIEQYSQTIEQAFVNEMFPKANNDADREANRSAIWNIAKLAVQGDKKPEAFNFQEASCVKLNNIEAARVLLDKMYNSIDADNVAKMIHKYEPEQQDRRMVQSASFLFTVKVVAAEGLVGADGTVHKIDPFLTLSDERGNRIAKTRTLYETTSPRWNETFDISVRGSLWLAATIYKQTLVEKHEVVGRAFLHLHPKAFDDFLAHDLFLDLDTQGRVIIRVSMEGEKDDIQFYFGRAFRSLKRAETDMVRMIIDKISPVIRYFLSYANLRKLIPSHGFMRAIDMSKMSTKIDIDLSKMTSYGAGLWRSVASSSREPEIPLPKAELAMAAKAEAAAQSSSGGDQASRSKGSKILTDADIENAIADLLEYFDKCMSVLKHTLSETAGHLVMSKIWKEILSIIDGLLLPPLSDQPSDMRPLSEKEVDVVLKWLKFLTNFFHADGEGVPIEELHNQKYKEIWSIGFFYDQHTDHLMEECVRAMQQQLNRQTTKLVTRNKSVYQQRNLGTIRKRKADKKLDKESTSSEMIMRILRLRPGTSEFLQQQISIMQSVNAQHQEKLPDKRTSKNAPGSRLTRRMAPSAASQDGGSPGGPRAPIRLSKAYGLGS